MLLRAALLNKGNPFHRYARSRIAARADYSEKELEAMVKPHVNKHGHWNGPVCPNIDISTLMSLEHPTKASIAPLEGNLSRNRRSFSLDFHNHRFPPSLRNKTPYYRFNV